MAGASAVQVGAAGFASPRAPLDIIEGIERFLQEKGVKTLADIVGAGRG